MLGAEVGQDVLGQDRMAKVHRYQVKRVEEFHALFSTALLAVKCSTHVPPDPVSRFELPP